MNENHFITLSNPVEIGFSREIIFKKSTKDNPLKHGFGIGNAKKIIEYHGGILKYEIFEKEIITKILVKL